jgi:hypothetical protein
MKKSHRNSLTEHGLQVQIAQDAPRRVNTNVFSLHSTKSQVYTQLLRKIFLEGSCGNGDSRISQGLSAAQFSH